MKPAGFEYAQGIVSAAYLKDATGPQWKHDADMKAWDLFMDKYLPGADKSDSNYIYGYSVARTITQVLKQCGDDLTRENIMKQAANLRNFEPGLLLSENRNQYKPNGLCTDRAIAIDEVRGTDVETVW